MVSHFAIIIVSCLLSQLHSEIYLDVANGDQSDWTLMTCSSVYCSNSTVFIFDGSKECHNPLLSVHFRLTDFLDPELQYLTISVNQQKLGFCTGPSNASFHSDYNSDSIPLYTDCLNDLSIAELSGYNPDALTLALRLSPHVTDRSRSYKGNLLYAKVAIGCSDRPNNKMVSRDWDSSLGVPANANLQCLQSGCDALVSFTALKPEHCRVPLLSLQFWMTDFDKEYEYLTVEVNEQYLGICEGGKQMDPNPNILSIDALDRYWNNYSIWCFEKLDISSFGGVEPEEITVRLSIQQTIDRNWLDGTPTPYLLDAMVTVDCGDRLQEERTPSTMTYDRRTTSTNYPYPHEVSIECQSVECGAFWEWTVLGSCPFPTLSLYYFANHYEDSMVEITVNDEVFGRCNPMDDTNTNTNWNGNESISTLYGMTNVRTCFEGLELTEMVSFEWTSRFDIDGTPSIDDDDIVNQFQFGFAVLDIDVLDGITNGTVSHLFINIDCITHSNVHHDASLTISDSSHLTSTGFPYGETALNCVYAGCSVDALFTLDIDFASCLVPTLDLLFWSTDFGADTEFLSIGINNRLYGWCDGVDRSLSNGFYSCLHSADIAEWAEWEINGNQLELQINASSHVDALDMNHNGFLLDVMARIICKPQSEDRKTMGADVFPNDHTLNEVILPIECQGVGCWTVSLFHIRDNICYQPSLSVSFWLSDFLTFDEYAVVWVNGEPLETCYGGGDSDLDAIWTCFEERDIRYILDNYPYNAHHGDVDSYYVDIGDVVNVSLKMSPESVWLDHNRNHSLLEGTVTLQCQPTNIPQTPSPIIHHLDENGNSTNLNMSLFDGDSDSVDSDNSSLRFVQLIVTMHKVTASVMKQYHYELRDRFQYSIDAAAHFQRDDAGTDGVAFTLQTEVDTVDSQQVSDLKETLRDSHFKQSVIESIHSVHFANTEPHTNPPSPTPTVAPSIMSFATETMDEPSYSPSTNPSFLKVLFTSATASDWFSFLGVLVLSTMFCACCIAFIGFCCVHHQRNKTRTEIRKYKQTQDDSDSDLDELQGMMHQINGMDADHPASIVNHIIGKTGTTPMAKRMFTVNRARSLKDRVNSVKQHVSKSRIFGSAHSDKMSQSHSNPSNLSNAAHSVRSALSGSGLSSLSPPQSIGSNPNSIAGDVPSTKKSVAIHPALSSAIETVQEMTALKTEKARHHELVVSSTMMEADTESESESDSKIMESSPSGIDLSEEFIRIEDDPNIDIQDLHDLNEMEQKKSASTIRHQHKKYSSIGYIDDDSTESDAFEEEPSQSFHRRSHKVLGMRVISEEKRQFRKGSRKKEAVKEVIATESEEEEEEEEEESDNVSELSEEETLQSIAAASFSQDI